MLQLNILPTVTSPTPIDLSSFTVPQIKDWAKNNHIKAPQGLKKADLIQYLTAAYQEKLSGGNSQGKNAIASLDVLQPKYADLTIDWITHLHTHGWAVVPVPDWNPEFTNMFFSWLESCSTNFNKNDSSTWKSANLPVMHHGILKQYFGHTELQWKIREQCAPIFARIWGCQPEDLICSYDGGCFLPCIPKQPLKNTSFKQWIHVDQNRLMTNFACVQGIVNFEENGPEDGGLVLVEGSQNVFAEYMTKHPSDGITWGPADMNEPLLSIRPLIKICAPAGHIILFDSRTFHANVHPYGSLIKEDGSPRFRMCTYVSMQPRIYATQKELTKRISLYEKGRMTGHWCYGTWFKETAEHPRAYGGHINRPANVEIAELNPLRRRLIGYE